MLKVLTVVVLAALATPAAAQFVGPGAGGAGQVITVQQVADVRVGSDVTLVGHIVEQLREDYFTFRDDTGDIRVEIDDRVWRRVQLTPENLVQLTGEVEWSRRGRYIDVETLSVLK